MAKSKYRRAIAAVLTVVMGFAMTTVTGSAATDPAPGANENVTKNVLVFGDSTSNGYGLQDYSHAHDGFDVNNNDLEEWTLEKANAADPRRGHISRDSHPWLLKNHIAEELGGDLSKVNLNAMCLGGMRTDELRALLDPAYYTSMEQQEARIVEEFYKGEPVPYKGFLTEHMGSYVHSLGGGDAKVDGHAVNSLKDAQDYTKAEIEKADVIVVDVCTNNFGTYLARRLMGAFGVESLKDSEFYNEQKIDDIEDVSAETKAAVNSLRAQLKGRVIPDNEYADVFIDSILYCYACCITNFSADLDLIRQINPTAKIIVVGVYNPMTGTTMMMNGEAFDFGMVGDVLFGSINTYLRAMNGNASYYQFADVSGGIETVVDQIGTAESLDELTEENGGAYALATMRNDIVEMFLEGPPDTPAAWQRVDELAWEAAKVKQAELSSLINDQNSMAAVTEEIRAFVKGDKSLEEMSVDTMSFLNIEERFMLLNGLGVHPSKKGCHQKADAVLKAYDSDVAAYPAYKQEIQQKLDDIRAMLDGTDAGKNLDEAVKTLAAISAALDALDESGLTADQLRQFFQLKKDLETAIAQTMDQLGITMDDLRRAADAATDPENIREVAKQIKALQDLIDQLPKDKEEAKAEMIRQLDNIQTVIEEYAFFLSEEMLTQIQEVSATLKEAVSKEDRDLAIKALIPIGQRLKILGEAVAGLPEFEAAVQEYMDAANLAISSMEGQATALETQMVKIRAKLIDVDLKVDVSFENGTVKAMVCWEEDPQADGYLLTRDDVVVDYDSSSGVLTYEDPSVQVGKACTYVVRPYIIDAEGDYVAGRTFTRTITPQVALPQGKLKKVAKGRNSFKATWKAVKGASGYQLSYKTGKTTKVKTYDSVRKLSATVKGLKANKKYTVKVRAYKTVNNVKYFGAWSKAKKVKTK